MARRDSQQEFVSEAEEILERMSADLTDLAELRAAGGAVPPDLVNRLFRSAHSLKGIAGLFGVEPVHDLSHALEDVLDALRLGRVSLDAATPALLERAVALFRGLLGDAEDAEALEARAGDVRALAAELAEGASRAAAAPAELDDLAVDPAMRAALTEYEEHRLRENLRQDRFVHQVAQTFPILSFEEGLSDLSASVLELGELISTLPAPGDTAEAEIRFTLLIASDLPAAEVAARLQAAGAEAEVCCAREGRPARVAGTAESPEVGEIESLKSLSETVRVDIRKLDELMNLVGELVIQRGALGELAQGLAASAGHARLGAALGKVHKGLDRKLRELQQAVLEVRMVPLRQVFEKVARVVRRLRIELGKDVRFEVRGADTELDKLIVEEIADPLMHVVRNALDHALEPEAERRAAGKDPQGCVRVEAFQRGNHVVVAVGDDGRGIDREALRARATERGLLEPGVTLSDRETLELIFTPGLSTRTEVTDTSGRGVGMDVVRHNLSLLGGVVDVESVQGRGTVVSMTLPITLAIVQSLVVGVHTQRFAVPLGTVHETLLLDPAEIQRSEGRELLNLRGEPLRLRRLSDEFALPAAEPGAKPFVVVVGMGDARIGLVVDRLEGQQDTVVKPIQGPVRNLRGIAGATVLGGPDPVLVLDVWSLLAEGGRRSAA